ncbi:MAG: hypothetical protein OEZ13_11710 [Spirochaetia bacterium]|nr:hypothetical protein [Spirochaetia bacterium]
MNIIENSKKKNKANFINKIACHISLFLVNLLIGTSCYMADLSGVNGKVEFNNAMINGKMFLEITDICRGVGYNIRGGLIQNGCGTDRYIVDIEARKIKIPKAEYLTFSLFDSHITRVLKLKYLENNHEFKTEIFAATYDLLEEDRYANLHLTLYFWPITFSYDNSSLQALKDAMLKAGYDFSEKSYFSITYSIYDNDRRVHVAFNEKKIHFNDLLNKEKLTLPFFVISEKKQECDCAVSVGITYNNMNKLKYFIGYPGGFQFAYKKEDRSIEFNLKNNLNLVLKKLRPIKY